MRYEYTLISPTGQIKTTTNLREFCDNHGFDYGYTGKLFSQDRLAYGWRCENKSRVQRKRRYHDCSKCGVTLSPNSTYWDANGTVHCQRCIKAQKPTQQYLQLEKLLETDLKGRRFQVEGFSDKGNYICSGEIDGLIIASCGHVFRKSQIKWEKG